MTFSEMYSSALTLELGTDDSTRLFLTARRKAAINIGLEEFADLTECLLRQSTVNTSVAVGEYNLLSTVNVVNNDFVRLAKELPRYEKRNTNSTSPVSTNTILIASGKTFQYRTVEWLNEFEPNWQQSTGGTPRYYYERTDGGRRLLGVFPPPNFTSTEAAVVVLPYVAKPDALVDDTSIPYSFASSTGGPSTGIRVDLTPYHQAAVHYGAYRLEKLRTNMEASNFQLKVFLAYVQRYLQAMKPKGGTTVKAKRSYLAEARRSQRRRRGPIDMNIVTHERYND